MEENTSKVLVGDPPLNAMTAGAGSSLFVINLCSSIAPVDTKSRNLPGLDNYRLYQVARVEDGRTRHRLRLGFFTSESHAESVLTMVRQQYPSAFTACLADEDHRFARGFLPQSPSPASVRPAAVANSAPPLKPVPAAKPTPAASAPTPPPTPAKPSAPTVAHKPAASKTVAPQAAPPKPAQSTTAAKPPAAADIITIEDLTWDPPELKSEGDDGASTAKHPVLSAVHKTQPVIKAPAPLAAPPKAAPAKATAPANTATPAKAAAPSKPAIKPIAAPPKADAGASMRVKAIDASARVPAIDASMKVKALNLTLSEPPPPAPAKATSLSSEPFRVSKGVSVGDLPISLHHEPAPKVEPAKAPSTKPVAPAVAASAPAPKLSAPASPPPAAASAPKAAPAPALSAAPPKTAPPAPAAKTPAPPLAPAAVAAPFVRHPDLDSTQTIRALTSAELNDDAQEKWFAIQLAASEQPVNLDTMPHLDIFEAYRLYSVALAGSGKIVHSLRLGFFKEEVSADAVGGYLKTFFANPSVLRISVAEYARFKDAPPPKHVEAAPPAKVVELSDARASRPVPTVTMEVPTPRTDATGSFRMNETGSFRLNDSGSFKPTATGAFKTSASGTHKVLTPSLKPAAKSGGVATKRASTGNTGKHKTLPKKSLSEQLLDEARAVELSESGIRKLPKNDSLLSKMLGKLTK